MALEFEYAVSLAAPADRVFEALVDPQQRAELMADYVSKIERVGYGAGSEYRMAIEQDGIQYRVVEKTEVQDDANRLLKIRMTDTGGIIPFADYRAEIRVQKAGEEKSVLVLGSRFIPLGLPQEEAREMAENNYRSFFAALVRKFGE